MLRRTGSTVHATLVRKRFDDPETDVQASAIFTYWALRGAQALDEVHPFMTHSEPKIQSAAVSGALRYGDEAARQIARPVFESMVAHAQPSVRVSAAYALGELPSDDGVDFLHSLLEDSDPLVRLQAVQSAGRLADPRHLPAVIAQLSDPTVGADAAEALVRYGVQLIPYLETCYAESPANLAVRRHIPSVVARIPGPQSVHFLLGKLDEPDDLARARLYIALGRLRRAGAQLTEADLAAINQRFAVETRMAYKWAVRASGPQLKSNDDLLEDAYSWRRRYAMDRLLYLIGILYPQANISQVRANLFGDDLRRRANAIELLDTLLSRPHKELFLPLLESSPKRMLEMADRVYGLYPPNLDAEFTAAVADDDSWLVACILFSLSTGWQDEFSSLIHQGLRFPNASVRETALMAARQHFKLDEYQTALQGYIEQTHDPDLHQQAYRHSRLDAEHQEGGNIMPITTMERILLLRGVELFKEIPAQELELIARLCTVLHFAPGERFISQGDVADGLYILVAGEVEVTVNDLGIIDKRKQGDVIGEIGVLANTLRTANCTATVETTALHIDQTDFWDLLKHNSTLSVSVIRVLVPKALSYPTKRF
jgi:HEAT repeat protein